MKRRIAAAAVALGLALGLALALGLGAFAAPDGIRIAPSASTGPDANSRGIAGASGRTLGDAVESAVPAQAGTQRLSIKLVEDPEKLPAALAWFARKGDYYVSDGAFEALFAGTPRTLWSTLNFTFPEAAGYILAFTPAGAKARVEAQFGTANVRVEKKPLDVGLTSIAQEGGAIVARSTCRTRDGNRLDIVIRYRFAFAAGRIDVAAEIRNAGPKDVEGLDFSVGASARQTYNFSPFNARTSPDLNFRIWQKSDHAVGWRYAGPQAISGATLPGRLRTGEFHRETYSLVAGKSVAEVLERLYALAGVATVRASLQVKNFEGAGPAEIFVRDAATGLVFFREFLEEPGALLKTERLTAAPQAKSSQAAAAGAEENADAPERAARVSAFAFPILPGTYHVRANLFPAVVEKTFRAGGATAAGSGSAGRGTPAASTASGPTASASQTPGPTTSTASGPASRPGVRSARHETWTLEAPPLARIRVSIADRKGRPVLGKVSFIGLAPTASPYFQPDDPIATGRSFEGFKNSIFPAKDGLAVTLPSGTYLVSASRGPEYSVETKVIEVLGGEKRDLAFSIDRAVEARGLVALDSHMHTRNSDGYVGIAERLRGLVAEGIDVAVAADHNYISDYRPELARLGFAGDIAVVGGFEVTARSGSIHFNSLPAVPRPAEPGNGAIGVRDETPADLFAASRAKNPGSLIHINHPRSEGLGYFITYNLDPERAATADAPFDAGFDVMEVMNGAKPDESNRKSVEDWFHLLNRGYAVRAVGSSDAHGIDGGEAGYSRTYVLYDGPKAQGLDQAALFAAVKKGRSFVSNGPIVAVTGKRGSVFARLFGGRSGATFGDIITAKKGRVDLDIMVTGAPWLDVSEVRVVINGERRTIIPVARAGRAGRGGTLKYRGTVTVEMAKDGWVAVEVVGREPLFPLIEQRSGDGKPDDAATPYAITNPIFVDIDGDGRSDPVWPEKIAIK